MSGSKLIGGYVSLEEVNKKIPVAIDGKGKLGYLIGEVEQPFPFFHKMEVRKLPHYYLVNQLHGTSNRKPYLFYPQPKMFGKLFLNGGKEARDNQTPKGPMRRGKLRKLQEVLQNVELLGSLEYPDPGLGPNPIEYPPIQTRSKHEEAYTRPPSFVNSIFKKNNQCYEDDWENPKDAAQFRKREENDRMHMFLAGLNQILDEEKEYWANALTFS
ncbi:hypothetical protein CR513_51786, partial [Mucuna pruriens]